MADTSAITDRMQALQRLATHFPDRTTDELTAMADWVMTGGTAINPAGLERAAKRVASAHLETIPSNSSRGLATEVVLAYLGH